MNSALPRTYRRRGRLSAYFVVAPDPVSQRCLSNGTECRANVPSMSRSWHNWEAGPKAESLEMSHFAADAWMFGSTDEQDSIQPAGQGPGSRSLPSPLTMSPMARRVTFESLSLTFR